MSTPPIDLLAIGAHPDDVELFCGGTVAKMVAAGRSVVVAHLSAGERGTRGSREERLAEADAAAKILGVEWHVLDCGDTRMENTESNREQIIRLIRELKPTIVLTHDPNDRHPDHRKANEMVTDACFYAGVGGIETDHPRHRPQGVFYFIGNGKGQQSPQFVVDVTTTFEQKMQSLKAYQSQFFNPAYQGADTYIASERFWLSLEGRARMFGSLIDANYGEAFVSDRPLPVGDPTALFAPSS